MAGTERPRRMHVIRWRKTMAESFVFYGSFGKALENLPAEQYKECMQAIIRYAIDGEEPESSDPMVSVVFTLVKPQLDANVNRRENGSKGGRPKNHRLSDEKPTVTESKTIGYETENHRLSDAKPNVNVNVNANVNANENANANGECKCNAPAQEDVNSVPEVSQKDLHTLGVPPALTEQVSEWISNRAAKGETLTQSELRSFISLVKSKTAKYGAQAVSDLITENMASGYKGITWDRLEAKARDKPKKSVAEQFREIEL